MGNPDDAKENALDAVRTRGARLDEAVAKVGEAIEAKVTPVAEEVTEKFVERTGGFPDDQQR